MASEAKYLQWLLGCFAKIYEQNLDNTPEHPVIQYLLDREQVLFMQYHMEKKGKNFGINEVRSFKFENGKLYQLSKTGDEKQLPLPQSVKKQLRQSCQSDWLSLCSGHETRLRMQFSQRTQINVYFHTHAQCNQMQAAVVATMQKHQGRNLAKLARNYECNLMAYILKKIVAVNKYKGTIQQIKRKTATFSLIRNSQNDKQVVECLMKQWFSKSLWNESKQKSTISIVRLQATEEVAKGEFKLWAAGEIKHKATYSREDIKVNQRGNTVFCSFSKPISISLELSSLAQMQIQLYSQDNVLKSQRFAFADLRRLVNRNSNIAMMLNHKGQHVQLQMRIQFGAEALQLNPAGLPMNPKHYKLVDELYNDEKKSFELGRIHLFYKELYETGRANKEFYFASFWRMRPLTELLQTEAIIGKFYMAQPFSQFVNVTAKATFVYSYWLAEAEKYQHYDVERLYWKFGDNKSHDLLKALKAFSLTSTRFNFTEPLNHLCIRAIQIVQSESLLRWKQQMYQKSQTGILSMSFFLMVGLIRMLPSILLYQSAPERRALPANTLLFHYVFKKCLPEIYEKISKLELNLPAYFGQEFVNLLARILHGETYCRVLLALLEDRKNNTNSFTFPTLIGTFLALMELVDGYDTTYTSGQHYLLMIQEIARLQPNRMLFFELADKWTAIVRQEECRPEQIQLQRFMQQYHQSQNYSSQLSDIAQEIYKEFICYRYKNEGELRKLHLVIDQLELPMPDNQPISISIYQSQQKLYEHEFRNVDLGQLHHEVELKLTKLDELHLICTVKHRSYYCLIDPKEIPSNYYFHSAVSLVNLEAAPLKPSFVFLQTYIKDSCEVETLQNPLPEKYLTTLLLDGINKEDIIFCSKYLKAFRMRDNNFNLLYSKLGWYGNHYILPNERIIQLQALSRSPRQINVEPLVRYTRCVYGKAVIPKSPQGFLYCAEIMKGYIVANFLPSVYRNQERSEESQYDSAGRLLCYTLDNFYIPSSTSFIQFYYKMNQELPLLRYLSYLPEQERHVPGFTMQVSNDCSVSLLVFGPHGLPFRTDFTRDEAKQIQALCTQTYRLPEEIQIKFTADTILLDSFLIYLRLNILNLLCSLRQSQGRRDKRSKKWPNSLVFKNICVPNYPLYNFYELMNESKQIAQLQLQEAKVAPEVYDYNHYGWITGRWIPVAWLAVMKSPNHVFMLVAEQLTRRKYWLNPEDFIRTQSQNPKEILFTDEEMTSKRERVEAELAELF